MPRVRIMKKPAPMKIADRTIACQRQRRKS